MKDKVPCRIYSNSRRSTLPGTIGRPGCFRSRACTPVISSVLSTASPCWASSGACLYSALMSFTFSSNRSSVSLSGVNQYRIRCGLKPPFLSNRAACLAEMLIDNPALHQFICNLTPGPLADWSPCFFWFLAGQLLNLANLVGGQMGRCPRSRQVFQTFLNTQIRKRDRLQIQPASSAITGRCPGRSSIPWQFQACSSPRLPTTRSVRVKLFVVPAVCCLTSFSNSWRSASVKFTCAGFGPGMMFHLSFKLDYHATSLALFQPRCTSPIYLFPCNLPICH